MQLSISRGQLLSLVFREILLGERMTGRAGTKPLFACATCSPLSKAAREARERTGAAWTRLCREMVRAAIPLPGEVEGGFGPQRSLPWESA